MPYSDGTKPFVRQWFAGSEGAEVNAYNDMLREENQDRLEAEGGACIMYTHFGSGFVAGGELNARFDQLMTRMSRKNGWFVPVSTLLDFLVTHGRGQPIRPEARTRLEWSWLLTKIRHGGSS
jgi:hypothetical protein